mmetsp:Transcript_42645/g.92945  ORF Transcript_42645/g.92945 Transcript_42645/m.92945 type:complete len:318 (+) Transcript_42645:64-1017(+)
MGNFIVQQCQIFVDPFHGLEDDDLQLALRVIHAPIEASSGVQLTGWAEGDEVAVKTLEKPSGLKPLRLRFEPRKRPAEGSAASLRWPATPRFSLPRSNWQAAISSSDGQGGLLDGLYLLTAMATPAQRTVENALSDVEDSRAAGSYAHRFNTFVKTTADGENLLPVKVAAPVVCMVLYSANPSLQAGSVVTVAPYEHAEVQKFVFDGSEEFVEIPQAFFHYTANSSSSKEFVCDVQGCQTDEGVILVDPCVLRSSPVTVTGLLASAAPAKAGPSSGPSSEHFERLHPKCGQLCKTFDPQRRGGVIRTMCGFNLGACF